MPALAADYTRPLTRQDKALVSLDVWTPGIEISEDTLIKMSESNKDLPKTKGSLFQSYYRMVRSGSRYVSVREEDNSYMRMGQRKLILVEVISRYYTLTEKGFAAQQELRAAE